ncbi:coiled-coil domain-containing protein 183 isoform X1 [Monodelphis domestica]|uniref:coiled-coil domain-containing protein 183 isoform X1 n=1 Tax=Monodelphis domestica TaxID=13616 RepID=UPI0000F2B66B|nr:coiled-coil domain-containing protein 183 isoform X1 [Monodelphis domestica]
MRVKEINSLKDRIHELKTVIKFQEKSRLLQSKSFEERTDQNKDVISVLQNNVRHFHQDWIVARKYDEWTIARACRKDLPLKLATSRSTVEVAREKLRKYVFDRVNVHNVMLHLVRQRGERLENMQSELENLLSQQNSTKEELQQLQIIRQLENNIEKTMIKINTSQNLYSLYVRLLDYLKKELTYYPPQLDKLQNMVLLFQKDLSNMSEMTHDAMKMTEVAKVNMSEMETAFVAERKTREQKLTQQKKMIEKIHSTGSERHRRGRRDMEFSSTLVTPEPQKGRMQEVSQADIEYQADVTYIVDSVKNAVQCSHLWDIAGRFLAQKNTQENLLQQTKEYEQKRKELEALLQKLDLERALLKFHQNPNVNRFKKLEKELSEMLNKENKRLQLENKNLTKNEQLLLNIEIGIDNLFIRLIGIALPSEKGIPGPTDTKDAYSKLQYCERKLLYLIERTKKYAGEYDESSQQVRDFLEESTLQEKHNVKITFEDADDDGRESFEFPDVDQSYVPSREEIKKQSIRFIDAKTRNVKKPKKK